MNELMKQPVKIEGVSIYVLALPAFKVAASKGGFTAYDGIGYYADDTHYDKLSNVWEIDAPAWATKVVWVDNGPNQNL